MRRIRTFTSVALLAAGLGACSQSDSKTAAPTGSGSGSGSTTAGTDKTGLGLTEACSGTYALKAGEDKFVAGGSDAARKEALAALTAIPAKMRAMLFAKLGGKIVLSDKAPKICAEQLASTDATIAVNACWIGDVAKPPMIYVKNDAASVRAHLVRQFFFVFFDVMLNTKFTKGPAYVTPRSEDMRTLEKYAGLGYYKDLLAKEGASSASIGALFGKDFQATGLSDEQLSALWDKIPKVLRSSTGNTALVNAADRFYCSDKTRAAFTKIFGNVSLVLAKEIVKPLSDALKEDAPAGATALMLAAETRLPLFGRWGPGNGPLRQGLSNWSDYRQEARAEGYGGFFPGARQGLSNWSDYRQEARSNGFGGFFPGMRQNIASRWGYGGGCPECAAAGLSLQDETAGGGEAGAPAECPLKAQSALAAVPTNSNAIDASNAGAAAVTSESGTVPDAGLSTETETFTDVAVGTDTEPADIDAGVPAGSVDPNNETVTVPEAEQVDTTEAPDTTEMDTEPPTTTEAE